MQAREGSEHDDKRSRKPGTIVRATKKGCKTKALAVTRDQAAKDDALAAFEALCYTRGTLLVMASCWSTWCSFHRAWFGHRVVTPLTCMKIMAIACISREGGYIQFANYLSVAKNKHVERGHAMTQRLEHTAAKATRAATRGIGPAKQAAALCFQAVANHTG